MQLNDFKNFVCYYQLTTVNLVQSVLYLLREFKVKVEWTNPGVWGGGSSFLQRDASLQYETMHKGMVHCVVCLLTPHFQTDGQDELTWLAAYTVRLFT